MFRSKPLLALVGLLVILSMLLVACGPAPTPTPVPTATKPPAPAAPTATPKPAEPTKPPLAEKQTLIINRGAEPDTIDPQKSSFVGEIAQIMKVFENLLTFDTKGNLVPAAAEKYTISPDGKVYTFTLRKGLKYSDGQPLTAKNFEYGWKRHMDPEVAGDYAFTGYEIVGAEEYNTADPKKLSKEEMQKLRDAVGVKALDDLTLQITLKNPACYFLSVLATWCGAPSRQDMVEKGGEKWTEPATYIGNGPFILKTWEHQVKLVYESNPNYRLGAPTIKTWTEVMINDATVAFTAYRNNELDVVGVGSGELPVVQADAQLSKEYVRQPGTCTFYLGFNTNIKPFDNMKVRQAIAQAVDREVFVKNIQQGLGIPAYQFLPPGFPGYYPDLQVWKLDAAAAKKTLADAGFPDGKGLPELKFTYSSSPRNQSRAEFFQQQLKDNLGVTLKLDPVEAKAFSAMVKKIETTPMMYFLGWCQDYPDPQDWYTTVYLSTSTIGHTGWKNAEFDKLCQQADIFAGCDKAKRDELYKKAAQLLVTEAPHVNVYHDVTSMVVKPWVIGWTSTPLDYYFSSITIMDVKILKH
jgi:oligopeptide transport system substrate-binding protein